MQWVVKGALDVDIGANPSAEGDEDEGVDDQVAKVVDIVDTFRLQVSHLSLFSFTQRNCFLSFGVKVSLPSVVKTIHFVSLVFLQEQPAFDKKQFVTWMKRYIKLLTPKLEGEKQEEFKKNIEGTTKFLLSKLKDLQL